MRTLIAIFLFITISGCAATNKPITNLPDALRSKPAILNPEDVIQLYYKLSKTPIPAESWLGRSAKSLDPQFVTSYIADKCGYARHTFETIEPCKKVAEIIQRHTPAEISILKVRYPFGYMENYDFSSKKFFYCLHTENPNRSSGCPIYHSQSQTISVYDSFAFKIVVEGRAPISFNPETIDRIKEINSAIDSKTLDAFLIIKPYDTTTDIGIGSKSNNGYEDHFYYPNKHIVKAKLIGIQFFDHVYGVPRVLATLSVDDIPKK